MLLQSEVDTESIGHVLCKKAHELKACAVVMASHSRTSLQQFFLGSVTDFLTRHCSLPVLVVH